MRSNLVAACAVAVSVGVLGLPAAAQDTVAQINFQPSGAATPAGWAADTGDVFDATLGYGWDDNVSTKQRDYNPDVLLDTYAYVQNTDVATWEYALPNGTYLVTLVAGSPQWGGTHTMAIEGDLVLDAVDTRESFVEVTDYEVTIGDGRLSVTLGGGPGRKTKICYLVIRTTDGGSTPPPDPTTNTPPRVSAAADVTSGDAPLTVAFTGTAEDDEGSTTASWAFGDGANAAQLGVSHTYATPGTYEAVLTVTDEGGLEAQASITIVVNAPPPSPNTAPRVSVSADVTSGDAPLTVVFTATAEDDEGATTASWAFGDGSDAAQLGVSHTYATPGTYEAVLTVTDEGGLQAEASITITVNEPPAPPPDDVAGDIHINFQPGGADVPAGYLADDGAAFDAGRGYGWTGSVRSKERNFDPDQRLDTYLYVTNTASATWEYALPNGSYEVTLVAGSPQFTGRHTVVVEGITVIDDAVTSTGEFVEVTRHAVDVADGRLSVRIGGTGNTKKTKICYLVIHEAAPAVGQPPTASASATPTIGYGPLDVAFTGSGSDPDGTAVSYAWDFGDGSTSTEQSPSHTYETSGMFTARLTVTDGDGRVAAAEVAITVAVEEALPPGTVTALLETDPVPGTDDAADDPSIWVHPTDPSQSVIIATDKHSRYLIGYALTGEELWRVSVPGGCNNVDVRGDVVACSVRYTGHIGVFLMDPTTRTLTQLGLIDAGIDTYGLTLYESPTSGRLYAFVSDTGSGVEQWEIALNPLIGTKVRELDTAKVEGMAVDDEAGRLFLAEENVGLYVYDAEPAGGDVRTQIGSVATDAYLAADLEGVCLYRAAEGKGYIIVSAQSRGTFAVYDRQAPHGYIGSFEIVAGLHDQVSDNDGIEVINIALGDAFPYGVLIAQDGNNTGPQENQNFKLIPWERIADALGLIKDATYGTE